MFKILVQMFEITVIDYTSLDYASIINNIQIQILNTTKCYLYVTQCLLWVWAALQDNCPHAVTQWGRPSILQQLTLKHMAS